MALLDWNKKNVLTYFIITQKVLRMWAQFTRLSVWTSHPLHHKKVVLCFDRLKTNHSYYINQRSAPLGHICYIWGQGVSYVLTQPYIISYVLISHLGCRCEAISLQHEAGQSFSDSDLSRARQHKWNAKITAVFSSNSNVNHQDFSNGVLQHLGILKHLGVGLFCHVHSCTPHIITNVSLAQAQGSRGPAERWLEMMTSLVLCHWAAWWQAEGMQGGTAGWKDKNNTSVNFCLLLLANGNMLAFTI